MPALISRLYSQCLSAAAALMLICNALSATAQPVPERPATPIGPPLEPFPGRVELLTRQFADIHVEVQGPNTVKISWMPLPGANQYILQRDGVQIGPVYPSDPAATQAMSAIDNSAPANSHLTYTIVALHLSTIVGLPGTPNAGAHTGELPMQTSNAVAAVTPAAQPSFAWILRSDAEPAIAPNSEILLFVHGMDSRAEEADDITKALFMATASPSTPPPPPSANPTVSVLNQLLKKYESCILEKYETKQDMLNRGLPANLSGLTSTNGLQPRGTVTCVAGNECSLASRTTGFAALQAQANRGDPVNFQMSLERAIPKDCFQCAEHAEWHTKHVHCTMEVGGNSGILKGPAFEACKAGVDIEALATLVKNDISGIISGIANNPSTVPDVTGGASIATNHTTVHFTSCPNPASGCPETGPMACEQPDLISSNGAHVAVVPYDRVTGNALYFELLVPKTLLDDTPMSAGAIFNVPAAHNIGPNEGRLHPDLRTAAKAADPLQSLKFAAYGFAAGCGGPGFLDRAIS